MSTDRKLLKLAARAVGLEIDKSSDNGGGSGNTGFDLSGNLVIDWHNGKTWNPLIDDGDALRLAVALAMMVDFITKPPLAYMSGHVVAVSKAGSFYELGFTAAATRRAIVRAAAEIGMGVP